MSATALDYKYVYVNYVLSPGTMDAMSSLNQSDKSTDGLTELQSADSGYSQFIEIVGTHSEQSSLILQQQHFADDATFISPDGNTVQFLQTHPDPSTVVMVAQPQDDQLDVLNQEIVSIEEINRDSLLPTEDHLQRLTNELLLDDHEEQTHLEQDTSCGSLIEEDLSEEDDDSEHDLTNLAWLSDPNRNIAVNVLAAAAPVEAPIDDIEDGHLENKDSSKTSKSGTVSKSGHEKDAKEMMIRDQNLTQERFNKFMLQVQE